jgi:diguanylate cyclase
MQHEQAQLLGDAAMQSMALHGVDPTPANFAVWFHFHTGEPKALKQTIDVLLANKRTFDKAVCQDLFAMYVSATKDGTSFDIERADRLTSIVDAAQRFLATAITDNKEQLQTLDGISDQVTPGADPRALIQQLVDELSQATERATNLEESFAATSQELDQVRKSFSQAEQQAHTDELTGLANRRSLNQFLRSAQARAMEDGQPLSVLLFDIDHFKSLNDSYGHQVGDQVLRLVAGILKQTVREDDLAARYGGEEMMIVLPGAPLSAAIAVGERIRTALAGRTLRRRSTGEALCTVTTSVGAAQFRPGESSEALVARCDAALYAAKAAGRNRTIDETMLASAA